MKGTPLTEETYEYIVRNFAKDERALLERMSVKARAAGLPMIMIGEDQAKFIGFFLKAIQAKRALDVGTLFGYSAAIMARAMGPGSEVVTLEYSEANATVARENLDDLYLRNVQIKTGPALEVMKLMRRETFDFILIDADKPNYVNYLNEALRLIKTGGVIAGDNAMAWGKVALPVNGKTPKASKTTKGEKASKVKTEEYHPWISPDDDDFGTVRGIQEFNTAVSTNKRLFSILIPIGDGMTMGVVGK